MRQPRTLSELLASLGRRQNAPVERPSPVPAPVLLLQPGVTTRSIPGFMIIPTPSPTPSRAASVTSSARTTSTTPISRPSQAPTTTPRSSASAETTPARASRSVSQSSASPSPTVSNIEVGNLVPGPSGPPTSTTGTIASELVPTESAEPPPDRGAANADGSPESRGAQIGMIVGILVGIGLLAGLLAMFCVRRYNKKKAKKNADRAPTPDFISRPLARKDSDPWQPPIRSTSGGGAPAAARAAQPDTAGDSWPMGAAAANRNSMENGRYDEKQYTPYRAPPTVAQDADQQRQQEPQGNIPVSRFQVPPSGGDQYGQYATPPPPPNRESLSRWGPIAQINEHYAQTERQVRESRPGANIAPPSPLFFKPVAGKGRPDSATFGAGGDNGRYAEQQSRY